MNIHELYQFGFFGPASWVSIDEKKAVTEQYTFHTEHKTFDGKVLEPLCTCWMKIGDEDMVTNSWIMKFLYPENDNTFLRLQFNSETYKVGFLDSNEIYLENENNRKVLKRVH
jgi:hypothetical protein